MTGGSIGSVDRIQKTVVRISVFNKTLLLLLIPLKRLDNMIAAISHLQSALARNSTANMRNNPTEEFKKQQEDFNEHMLKDSAEILSKIVASFHSEMKTVLDEVVNQTHDFWVNMLHKQVELHQATEQNLKRQLDEANSKFKENMGSHGQRVQELVIEVEELKNMLEEQQEREKAKVAHLTAQLNSSDKALEEAGGTYKELVQDLNIKLATAQASLRDAELKGQQKRLVLGQTVESQQKQLEDLIEQLRKSRLQVEELEMRNKKLTAVSQHLLGKHHVKQQQQAATYFSVAASAAAVIASAAEDFPALQGTAAVPEEESTSATLVLDETATVKDNSPLGNTDSLRTRISAAMRPPPLVSSATSKTRQMIHAVSGESSEAAAEAPLSTPSEIHAVGIVHNEVGDKSLDKGSSHVPNDEGK
ncbi:hypothetical protein CEUSTIGMA_g6969.t1 [Chlamydomonas eustigma]|uniref:Uncharacterized protein n=1 Tax=Chlamydomonas eustigma TaxID=1157962 RepID=A0A250X8X3_9CHLO|nr:hypothetical protein CEUSTIGMA_g6969.t1 [Chlamydomonas eustigma]|eukprot:GAX79528.1 hypothetical protein CEUSTIGMA_g6969.t1 [Chlamydomonas eustigma]